MLRLASLCLALFVLGVAVVACGDDDEGGTPTPTATTGTTASPGGGVTPGGVTATPDTGLKSEPPAGETSDETLAPTAPGVVPTAPPTASEGIRAVAPEDDAAFAAQFQGQPIDFEACTYDPGAALVTCSSVDYAIDPPIVGQDISCNIWVVGGVRELVQCTSQEPLQTTYYEILE